MSQKYECSNGTFGIGYYDDKKSRTAYIPCGKDFDLVVISKDIDTDKFYLGIKFEFIGEENEIVISRDDATDAKMLQKYAKYGLDITSTNAKVAVEIIRIKEREYELKNTIQYCHSILGWKNVITNNGVEKRLFFTRTGNKEWKSQYNSDLLDISCKGEYKEWIVFVKKNVVGNTGLEFGIASALATILHSYLKGFGVDCDNFIIHLVGNSSSGKTTVLMLTISVFANPQIGDRTLISTWNATKNAIITRLLSANGYMFGLDEVSMVGKTDMSSLVYAISTGKEKDRLTREGNMKESKTGSYIVMSTGESSILSKCSNNVGLRMRVLEFVSRQWTTSAEQSEKIKDFVMNNHGRVAKKFSRMLEEYVEKNGIETLLSEYQKCRDMYEAKSYVEVRKARLSTRYGLILLGARLAKKFLKLNFDVENICDFILENENVNLDDIGDTFGNFYETFVSWVFANRHKFKTGADFDNVECYGKIEKKSSQEGAVLIKWEEIVVRRIYFKNIIRGLGYEDEKPILSFLKEKGYLDHDKDRLTRKRIISGNRAEEVYVIKLDEISRRESKMIKSILDRCDEDE